MKNHSVQSWQKFGTSIFSQMTAVANQVGAVNLAQGFPDFDGPNILKDVAKRFVDQGSNQYVASIGLPALRDAVAKRRSETSGVNWNPQDEITVTCGATEGLWCALTALLGVGDELLCFAPAYDSYEPAAFARGATTRYVPLIPPDFSLTRDMLRNSVNEKTKVILLNTPQNPCGKVYSRIELEWIRDVAEEFDLIVVADEVYEEIVFDGHVHVSISSIPRMLERCVIISSISKTYSYTGWKVGYVMAPKELTTAIRNIHQFTVFCVPGPLQLAASEALAIDRGYYANLKEQMNGQRLRLAKELKELGWQVSQPQGTYFLNASYSAHSSLHDAEMAQRLCRQAGIATIPMSTFYHGQPSPERWLRFAFCKTEKTVEAALNRIRAINWREISS